MGMKVLFETGLTDVSTTDIEGIGTLRFDEFGNRYRWVYNASAFASRVGSPACYDATLYSGNNFLKHVLAAPADADILYLGGIFLSIIPTLNYGWIQTWGMYGSARVALATGGSADAGDLLKPSTLTATNGTAVARPYSFLNGVVIDGIPVSTVDFPSVLGELVMPHVITPAALATSSVNTTTVPQTFTVFIRGL